MKNMKLLLLFFTLSTAMLSCLPKDRCCSMTQDMMLRWDGERAVDGCGFIFVFDDGTERKAKDEDSIDPSFKTNTPTPVRVEFNSLNEKAQLCFSPTEFELIEVILLERR